MTHEESIQVQAVRIVEEISQTEVDRRRNFRNAKPACLYIWRGKRIYINDISWGTWREEAIAIVNAELTKQFGYSQGVLASWVVDLLRRFHVAEGRLPTVDEYGNIY